jgi:ABC-2 type transport system permease protein
MSAVIPRLRAAVASEWTKLVSVRSTYLSMASAAAIAIAGGIFSASGRAHEWATMTAVERAEFDPVNLSYDGLAFAQLAFAVLGVLAVTSEYATGLIRTTFTATPARRVVLSAKATILGLVTLILGEALSIATFLLAQIALHTKHLGVSITDPHALRAVLAAGLYLTALTLMGLGLGVLIRHSAGAITATFSLVFVIPLLANAVSTWSNVPEKWNLWSAGNSLISTHPPAADQPSTGLAALVCVTYVLVILGGAFAMVNHRDA